MQKKDFPIFAVHPNLVYLDSAATTQKPQVVIEAISSFYATSNASVHRGVYHLMQQATALYNQTREKVKNFINARNTAEIVFTRGTTASLNLLSRSLGNFCLEKGDVILLTKAEHHSNLVPWQMIAKARGCQLKFINLHASGEIDLHSLKELLDERVKIVSIPHVSNVFGHVNPLKHIGELTHHVGAYLIVDGAQGAPHLPLDVQDLNCDFYVFSGHKLYGPTGIGVLYGKLNLLEQMPPDDGGGDMIEQVTLTQTTYSPPPLKFEAGTPMVAQVIGLGAAIDYVNSIGMVSIAKWEAHLLELTLASLQNMSNIKVIGEPNSSLVSFTIEGVHPLDLATLLDCQDIAIRSGHLCNQPAMDFLGITSCARISFGVYTTEEDIEYFLASLKKNVTVRIFPPSLGV